MTPDPYRSKLLFGNRHQAVADGVEAIAIKIRLRDSKDRPVAGRLVELMADRDGVDVEQPAATDADGRALGYIRATTAGPVNITGFVLPAEASSESI